MKYSNYFRYMIFVSCVFLGGAVEAYLETMPTACALFSVVSFFFIWGASMAPDNEKYSDEYYKKHKK
jgi:hypothetical protein